MKKNNKLAVLLAAFALIACPGQAADSNTNAPSAPASKPATLFADKVLAKGKGFEIKQSEVEDLYAGAKATFAARGQILPESRRPEIEGKILDQLVAKRVLVNRATEAEKTKAQAKSEEYYSELKKRQPSEEAFLRQLKAEGMTLEQFRKRLLDDTTCETVVERELKSQIKITAEQVKKFYDDNPTQFEQPERVRASHVLITTKDPATGEDLSADKKKERKELADKVLARAKAGEDFGKLAKEFSDDPGSRDKGGEYTFPRGQMVPEFENAAFALDTSKISDIVTTPYGYHIIKTLEKMPARKISFSEAEADIKEHLIVQETQKQLPDYLEKVKKEANVEVLTAPAKSN
jgi:peptidyl-prolyl cis-trans isomerase C